MIGEFVAGLEGLASARAVFAPDVLLGASRISVFSHQVAAAAAHGGTLAEALVAAGPLGLAIGKGGPARLPPRLVAVFVAVQPPWVGPTLGELCEAGLHGIVVGNPVFARVNGSGHF